MKAARHREAAVKFREAADAHERAAAMLDMDDIDAARRLIAQASNAANLALDAARHADDSDESPG